MFSFWYRVLNIAIWPQTFCLAKDDPEIHFVLFYLRTNQRLSSWHARKCQFMRYQIKDFRQIVYQSSYISTGRGSIIFITRNYEWIPDFPYTYNHLMLWIKSPFRWCGRGGVISHELSDIELLFCAYFYFVIFSEKKYNVLWDILIIKVCQQVYVVKTYNLVSSLYKQYLKNNRGLAEKNWLLWAQPCARLLYYILQGTGNMVEEGMERM